MAGTVKRSNTLALASYEVLRRDKALLALPFMGFLGSMAITLALWIPIWLMTNGVESATATDAAEWGLQPVVWISVIVSCLLVSLISVFFSVALAYGAWQRFQGNKPTISDCISAAVDRLDVIVPWSLLTGTIGLLPTIARNLRDFLKDLPFFIGPIITVLSWVFAIVWDVISFLVPPILVVERPRPLASFRRSRQLFRDTWGTQLVNQVSFGLIWLVGVVVGLAVVAVVGAIPFALGVPGAVYILAALGIVWVAIVSVAIGALTGVFKMALYLFATTGEVPGDFQDTGLEEAFANRKELKAERKAKRAARRGVGEATDLSHEPPELPSHS